MNKIISRSISQKCFLIYLTANEDGEIWSRFIIVFLVMQMMLSVNLGEEGMEERRWSIYQTGLDLCLDHRSTDWLSFCCRLKLLPVKLHEILTYFWNVSVWQSSLVDVDECVVFVSLCSCQRNSALCPSSCQQETDSNCPTDSISPVIDTNTGEENIYSE